MAALIAQPHRFAADPNRPPSLVGAGRCGILECVGAARGRGSSAMTPPRWDGLIVLDKPAGITSRAAVDQAARWLPRRTRIGHTGTLDPLASGVLVLCIGNATRLAEYVQQMTKTYRAGIILGARSDTDDADGTITPAPDVTSPALDVVKAALD